MSDDIAIKVDHVSKNFRLPHEKVDSVKGLFVNPFRSRAGMKTETQQALKDINFEVKKGEFFGIVGRNGSGKSTLLKIIANIYQPTRGKLTVSGRLVPFIELGVGFNPELSGRENTYLNGALMGFSTDEVDAKYDDIVKFAELERFMDQKLKNYSSGMQVRLAFSVATILADSDILLIDEVLAVGDVDFQRKCFSYFKQLKKLRKTVIFVSHDMSAVREYCDRAAFIENSKLVAVGVTDKIAAMYDKLFIEENTPTEAVTSEARRWGEGQVITTGIDTTVSPSEIVIVQNLRVTRSVDDCIVGVRIRDEAGKDVFGTNTKIQKIRIGELKADAQLSIVWKVPNILADGNFTVDPAVLLGDGITTSDWWDDAATFRVAKSRKLPYNIDPDFSVEVIRL